VLWLSDGGSTTGFGRVTHEVGERLVRDYGHEIHVLATNHEGDDFRSVLDPEQKTPLWLYRPNAVKDDDTYGRFRIIEMLGKVAPEVVVFLNDPQLIIRTLFNNPADPQRYLLQFAPLLFYLPCDGYNLPKEWTELLPQIGKVVTMANFGKAQYQGATTVYHGVDPERFWPVEEKPITVSNGQVLRSKRDCKRAFDLDPDGFLILRVDSNSGRKDYASLINALAPVVKRHSDIQVWLHCDPFLGTASTNIPVVIGRYGEELVERFRFPEAYSTSIGWPDVDLNALYNAADLFVSTSRGEGFGLTLAEAAMTGLPIIAQNVSSIPEVVGPGAKLLEPDRFLTVPSGEDVCLSDVEAFSNAVEELYQSAGARRSLGEAGRKHVAGSFSWDYATRKFDEFITELAVRERTTSRSVSVKEKGGSERVEDA
jgi:glycosyltransferase involved in cell wall biosynthesis